MKSNLLQRKWQKFLRIRWIFSFIPFLDFVLIAGSMALKDVNEDSDFDVIIGAREGRIFTVRAFCVFIFGLLGLRRKGTNHEGAASDKVCFSHFVTSKSYRLSPPHNDYWKVLYENVVPVYGRERAVENFFKANSDWISRKGVFNEEHWKRKNLNVVGLFFEFILQKWLLGWFFEKFVKRIQLHYIKKGIKNGALGYKPRVRYDDKELEFHPDTRRIEVMLEGGDLSR
jgi:hypothetical protein